MVDAGDAVKIKVPAYPGETFDGRVVHIGDVLDPSSRTVKLRCQVPNPDHRLKPEMFATVEVRDNGKRKVLTVPSKAILSEGDRSYVILAIEDHVFRRRSVDPGPEVDGRVRILGGLIPGEKIVAEGAIFMKREIDSQ